MERLQSALQAILRSIGLAVIVGLLYMVISATSIGSGLPKLALVAAATPTTAQTPADVTMTPDATSPSMSATVTATAAKVTNTPPVPTATAAGVPATETAVGQITAQATATVAAEVVPTDTIVPTETTAPTAPPEPTHTVEPTATSEPTATTEPFILTKDLVLSVIKDKWGVTNASKTFPVVFSLDTAPDRAAWDQFLTREYTVDGGASMVVTVGFDVTQMTVAIAPGNRVRVTLPPGKITSVTETQDSRSLTVTKGGSPYLLRLNDLLSLRITRRFKLDLETMARASACNAGLPTLATTHAKTALTELIVALDPSLAPRNVLIQTTLPICP